MTPDMTSELLLFRALAVVTCAGALACGTWLALHFVERVKLAFYRHQTHIQEEVAFLRLGGVAEQVVWGQVAVFALGVFCLWAAGPLLATLLFILALCVSPVLQTRRARRVAEMEAQLDGWLMALASSLRATPSLGEAIEYSLSLVANPLRDELDLLVKEQRLGESLDSALSRMGKRLGSRTLSSAFATLKLGQRTGGDISHMLERSAETLREMARLEGVVRVKTAEGKAQGYMMVALPAPLAALLHFIDPGFLLPLFQTAMGHWVLCAAGVAWLSSVLLIRRIVRVDI